MRSGCGIRKPGWRRLLTTVLFAAFATTGCSDDSPTEPEWEIINALPGDYGIFRIEEGSDTATQIYGSENPITAASLSPDGQYIVFSEQTSGEFQDFESSDIVIINSDGTGYQRLTDNDYMDEAPSWTPEGDIVFISTMGEVHGTDLYIMNTSGQIVEQLTDTPDTSESDPDVGTDIIVYTRDYKIWMMDRDGSNPHQITDPPNAGTPVVDNYPVGDYDPELSSDEERVAFERITGLGGREFAGQVIADMDIYVIDIEGGEPEELSHNDVIDALPKWSHDDSRIIFVHVTDSASDIFDVFYISPDGGGRTKLSGSDPIDFVEMSAEWHHGSNTTALVTVALEIPEEPKGNSILKMIGE
jgi:Tol biopolymer transport system component